MQFLDKVGYSRDSCKAHEIGILFGIGLAYISNNLLDFWPIASFNSCKIISNISNQFLGNSIQGNFSLNYNAMAIFYNAIVQKFKILSNCNQMKRSTVQLLRNWYVFHFSQQLQFPWNSYCHLFAWILQFLRN